jgi:hypothetical protein
MCQKMKGIGIETLILTYILYRRVHSYRHDSDRPRQIIIKARPDIGK